MYWYRECPSSPRLPILFFHGISPGLTTYVTLIYGLCHGRTALLFETPHIAMALQVGFNGLGSGVRSWKSGVRGPRLGLATDQDPR